MRPQSSVTAEISDIFVTVRTVAHIRPAEFDAVSSVLIDILATPFMEPTDPMVEWVSGEPTPIAAGVIADGVRYLDHAQGVRVVCGSAA